MSCKPTYWVLSSKSSELKKTLNFGGERLIIWWYLIPFRCPPINNEILFFFLSANKLVLKFATRYIKENQTWCIAAVESVNLVKSSCEHISKKSVRFTVHTQQTTHSLVMHSFVTSNALPLGDEHSTGCLWEGRGQRQQREPEQRSFIWGDKDKTPFLWRERFLRNANK